MTMRGPSLAQLVGLGPYQGTGVQPIAPTPTLSRGVRYVMLAFPHTNYLAINPESTLVVHAQIIFRPMQLCVDPYSAQFFDIVDFTIGKHSQLVSGNPVPALAFHAFAPGDTQMRLDTCAVGMAIELKVKRNARKLQICVTTRDGGNPPEDWKDVEPRIQRLHYAHPHTCGEVDVPYDFSWPIPDWAVARIADYEKDVGQDLDEPLLEDVCFRAYLKGITLDDNASYSMSG